MEITFEELRATARALVAPGKGILAADESAGTIAKRFAAIGAESTEESRRSYRELLFTAPGIEESISGVILFDETVRQESLDGTPFPALLAARGIIPGIKVDRGTKPLALASADTVTEGLDGLRERFAEYRELGIRFAKWRATYRIDVGGPCETAIWTNAHALARYAALAQEAGLVPIIEPEVLMDGGHGIAETSRVTTHVLHAVYTELRDQRVRIEGTLLKANMIVPGEDAPPATPVEVAEATVRCLRHAVPAAVPGIVFLSGGQSDETATANLDAINRTGTQPWELSFSFGRALQGPALRAWAGRPENGDLARSALARRARLNGLARRGGYSAADEKN